MGSAPMDRYVRGLAPALTIAAVLAVPCAALADSPVPSDAATKPPAATRIGPTRPDTPVGLSIVLPGRDEAGLDAFIRHVTTPGDSLFRHYLTPEQFAARFGADAADYRALATWAKAHGLTPGEEFAAHTVLPLSGSARAVQDAFHVTLTDYRGSGGRKFYSAAGKPEMPAALAGKVSAVLGFSNMTGPTPASIFSSGDLPEGARPNGAGTGPNGGFAAADLRTVYSVPSAPAGAPGETLAVFETGGFDPNDVAVYEAANGLPKKKVHVRKVNGYGGGINDKGVELEAVLDIDLDIAMNPKLHEVMVYEDGGEQFLSVALVHSLAAMTNDDKAQTIGIGYGTDEALTDPHGMKAENSLLKQAAAQGQSVFASAGSRGAYGDEAGSLNVMDPGAQPYVTSVGGTTLFTGPGETYQTEITWNDLGFTMYATGGGVSRVWPIPDWQIAGGVSVAAQNGGSSTSRNVPDVTAVGDLNTGVAIYSALNGGWIVVGGTSVGTAIWAGYTSVINATSKVLGLRQIGFANAALYSLGESDGYNNFHDDRDGTNGNVLEFLIPGFNAGINYDNVSGWGSPNVRTAAYWTLLPAQANSNPPPVPERVRGTAQPTGADFHWAAVSGATGYWVWGTNAVTQAGTQNLISVATSAKVTGLSPGTAYLFNVCAVSPGGVACPAAAIRITTPGS